MSGRSYGPEEKAKLEKLISEGSTVLREIDDLQVGLKETIKAVAVELGVKPSVISRAVKIAHKGDWSAYNEDWEEIEAILDITKRI
jgi:transposase-like protein